MVGALLVANVAIFLLQVAQGSSGQEWILRYGLIPALLFQGERFSIPGAPHPYALTLLSSSFLHGSVGHLAINLAFIATLGWMVERAVGAWRFVAIWTAGVILGGALHALLNSGSLIPTIGASAGVAALIGVVTVGGWVGLAAGGLWLAVQVIGALAQPSEILDANVAWQAHLGGFGTGIMGGLLLRWEYRRRRGGRRPGAAASGMSDAGLSPHRRQDGTNG